YDSAYHVNPFNWHLTGTDGFDYDRAIMESGERDLPARDLHAGDTAKGYVTFDAPKSGTVSLIVGLDDVTANWSYGGAS
ncbi:MAG: hypothetical protein ACRDQA_18325, partial [Nocardioidaceae bacterium]